MTMVRAAFALLHSYGAVLQEHSSSSTPTRPVGAALAPLEEAVGSVQAAVSKPQGKEVQWLWWCCLDILRLSVSGVLQQLLAAPQDAGARTLPTSNKTVAHYERVCTPSPSWCGAVWP